MQGLGHFPNSTISNDFVEMCECLYTAGAPEPQKLLKVQHGDEGTGASLASTISGEIMALDQNCRRCARSLSELILRGRAVVA
jgi:hypothetical protein